MIVHNISLKLLVLTGFLSVFCTGSVAQEPRLVVQMGHSSLEDSGNSTFSPDGKLLVTYTCISGEAIVWDIKTGKELNRFGNLLPYEAGQDCHTATVGFSESGKQFGVFLSAFRHTLEDGETESDTNSHLFTIDLEKNQASTIYDIRSEGSDVVGIAISNDRKRLIVNSNDGFREYDVVTGKIILTKKKLPLSFKESVFQINEKFGYKLVNSDALRFGFTNGLRTDRIDNVALIKLDDGSVLQKFTLRNAVNPAVSEDGRLFSTTNEKTRETLVYDIASGKQVMSLQPLTNSFRSFLSQREIYTVGINDQTQGFILDEGYSLPERTELTLKLREEVNGNHRDFSAFMETLRMPAAISLDGSRIAIHSRNGIEIRETRTFNLITEIVGTYEIISFSNTGSFLVGKDSIIEVSSGKKILTWRTEDSFMIPVIVFSFDDKYLFSNCIESPNSKTNPEQMEEAFAQIWNLSDRTLVASLDTADIWNLRIASFSKQGDLLAIAKSDPDAIFTKGGIEIWDILKGELVGTLPDKLISTESITFSSDGKFLFTGGQDRTIRSWNLHTNSLEWEFTGHIGTVTRLTVSNDGNWLLSESEDQTTKLWSITKRKEILQIVKLVNDGWAITTPDGRFDTNKLEDPKGLHWIMPDAPLTPLSFEVFTRDYYEPGLLPRLLKCTENNDCGNEFKQVRDLTSLNRTQPKIKIIDVKPIASSDAVTVTVEAEDVLSDYQKDKDKRFLRSGVYDVRLFRDGQIVGHSTTDEQEQSTHRTYNSFDEELRVWQAAHRVALDENGKNLFTFDVKLPNYKPGTKIEFSAYAFNDDRVKSETSRMTYEPKATDTAANRKRKAYIVTFGVNTFQNPSYNLRYAAKDAQVSQEMISKKLKEGGEFSEIVEIPLISDGKSKNATKENAKAVFDLLSGKDVAPIDLKELGSIANKLEAANPDDAVFILSSTHGYGDRNGSFYLLPSNISPGKGRSFDSSLMQNSISSDELSLWLRDIDASEIVMIIDACNAEWAVKNNNFKPGPMGSRGLGQLSYDKGMKILVATQSANDANEVREIRIDNKNIKVEQGLLTYALIQEGLAGNKADFKPKDNVIKISELLEYAVMRVPTLHESSLAARSSRKDLVNPFPKTERNTQQPYLFDFSKRNDSVLSRIPLSVRK